MSASAPRIVYDHNGITLWCGDCREVVPRLERLDHVITDPPYSEHTHAKQWIGAALTSTGAPRVSTAHKELGFASITDEIAHEMAGRFAGVARRWVLVFTDLEGIALWRECVMRAGLDYVRTCVWDKVDGAPQFTGDRPAAGAEAIVCAHPTGKKRWNGGGTRSVFRYEVNGERGAKPHPSTKPQPLMRRLVQLFTDDGETILDPFAGSGSTLLAARALKRRAVGVELDERFAEIAAERLRAFDAQGDLFLGVG